jgi:hypothetical protein
MGDEVTGAGAGQAGLPQLNLPLPPQPAPGNFVLRPDGTPVSALILARKQLDDDTTKTWLLVALCAVSAFYFGTLISGLVFQSIGVGSGMFGSTGTPGAGEMLTMLGGMIFGLGIGFVGATLVVIGANRAYKRQYDWITAEMVHGDMALMLVDESYGRMIQEWREGKYFAKFNGEVHLGETFALRMHHFGAYALQYFRVSQGQREFSVTPATPLNCWTDGIALGCLTCASNGCFAWVTVFLPMRIIQTYPRTIATRRAALDYFSGKWEHALEEKYARRGMDKPAPNWA